MPAVARPIANVMVHIPAAMNRTDLLLDHPRINDTPGAM